MSEENRAVAVDQEIAAGLVNIAFTIILAHQPFTKQFQVQLQRRQRIDPVPGKPLQPERLIGLALRIGKNREAPLVMFVVANQHRRLRKRHDDDLDVAPVEFLFECVNLDEVSLAGQSGQMTVKNQQQRFAKESAQRRSVAVKIEKAQLVDGDFFHAVITKGVFERLYAQVSNAEIAILLLQISEPTKRGAPT